MIVYRALGQSACAFDFVPEWHFAFKDIDQGEAGRKGGEYFLRLKRRPSIIIASADDIAISFIASVTAAGLKVPDDVSVAGVDDIPISKYIHPPLTTQKVEGYKRGTMVFKMLGELMNGDKPEEKHVYIRSVIIERESLNRI